jgi:hypothetical protein
MKKYLRYLLLSLGLLLLMFGVAQAKDITLAWDQNPELDVVGYKIYYKAESSAAPLDGWGANEGDSPIVVGNLTSATISGLLDNQTYYFAVSAFNAAGVESALSDIVASAVVPVLTSPARGAVAVARPITFRWDYAPFVAGMSYTLLVGTDPKLPLSGNQVALSPSSANHSNAGLAGLVGLSLLGGGLAARRSRILALLFWTAACLSLAACGGGGGGSDGVASGVAVTTGEGGSTLVLNQLTTPFATVAELQPGTTYYWQVVAVDAKGYRYESLIHSFSTAQ